jgi:hypothetical protein
MRPSRASRQDLVQALRRAGARPFSGKNLCCPFHHDRSPSASIFQGQDGHWRFKCHGCGVMGDAWDISAKADRIPLHEWLHENPDLAAPTTEGSYMGTVVDDTLDDDLADGIGGAPCHYRPDVVETSAPEGHHTGPADAPGESQPAESHSPETKTGESPNNATQPNNSPQAPDPSRPGNHARSVEPAQTQQSSPPDPGDPAPPVHNSTISGSRLVLPAIRPHDISHRTWATREEAQADLAQNAGGTLEACYDYVEQAGAPPIMVVLRIALPQQRTNGKPEKTFRQISPSRAGWVAKAPPAPWPLYRLPEIINASTVVVVEGEKACDALWGIGIVATTTPGGALRASQCDLTPLDGKQVILWPDHDDKGRQHMAEIQRLLCDLQHPPRITMVDPNAMPVEMPRKGDAVEFINAIAGDASVRKSAVLAMIRAMSGTGAIDDLQMRIEDQAQGRFVALPLPWPMLHTASQALLPGTVTLLCGGPGAAKSFMALHIALHAHQHSIPVALLELEETHAFYQQRILAMLAKFSGLMRPDYVRANAEQVRQILQQFRGQLISFNPHLFVIPSMRLHDVIAWIEAQCRAGYRLIMVDPITVADAGGLKPWEADAMLMRSITPMLNRYGAALILVTHPGKITNSKGGTAPNLNDLAGGAAYQRMAQCILWLQNVDQGEGMVETERHGTMSATFNRRVMVLKTRNGAGMGQKFAFSFRGDDFQFIEVGKVINPVRAHTAANMTPLGPLPLAPSTSRYPEDMGGPQGSSPGRGSPDAPLAQRPLGMRGGSSWGTPLSALTAFADSLMEPPLSTSVTASTGTATPSSGPGMATAPDRPTGSATSSAPSTPSTPLAPHGEVTP